MRLAAAELAMGILGGLYRCRDGAAASLLEYSPDYASERALDVVDWCKRLDIELPIADILDSMPAWSAVLRRGVAGMTRGT